MKDKLKLDALVVRYSDRFGSERMPPPGREINVEFRLQDGSGTLRFNHEQANHFNAIYHQAAGSATVLAITIEAKNVAPVPPPKVPSVTLEKIKRYPTLKRHFAGKMVLIWSGEHQGWWDPGRSGYYIGMASAGVYTFEDALACSGHCDKSKGIKYQLAEAMVSQQKRNHPGSFGEWLEKNT